MLAASRVSPGGIWATCWTKVCRKCTRSSRSRSIQSSSCWRPVFTSISLARSPNSGPIPAAIPACGRLAARLAPRAAHARACFFARDHRCWRSAQYPPFPPNCKTRRPLPVEAQEQDLPVADVAVATMKALPKSLWASTATPAASYPWLARRRDGRLRHRRRRLHRTFDGAAPGRSRHEGGAGGGQRARLGASGRNGGQVIPGLKLDPSESRAKYGDERGGRLTADGRRHRRSVFDLIQGHAIACDASRDGWIQAAPGPKGLAEVRNRAEEWAAEGADVAVLERDEVRCAPGRWRLRRCISRPAWRYHQSAIVRPRSGPGGRGCGSTNPRRQPGDGAGAGRPALEGVDAERHASPRSTQCCVPIGYTDRLWPGLAETVIPCFRRSSPPSRCPIICAK